MTYINIMENDKNKTVQQKLSYEQLKAYTDQIREQAKRVFEENKILKQMVNSKDIEYAFRCLDHADLFSKDFIKAVVNRIEELMNPEKQMDSGEENQKGGGI